MMKQKFLLMMMMAMGYGLTSMGANVNWTNASGGNWSVGANWSNGSGPGAGDTAVITLAGTYTVTVDMSITCQKMLIGGASGLQTFSVANYYTIAMSKGIQVNTRGVLDLQYATINCNQPIVNANRIKLRYNNVINAPVNNSDTVEVAHSANTINQNYTSPAGSVLYFSSSDYIAGLTIANGFTNNGSIVFNSVSGYHANLYITAGSIVNTSTGVIKSTGNYGSLTIQGNVTNNGTVTIERDLRFSAAGNSFVNNTSGNITATNNANLYFDYDSAKVNGGTITINSGSTIFCNGGVFIWDGGSYPSTGNMNFSSTIIWFNTSTIPGKYKEFAYCTMNSIQNPVTNSKRMRFNYGNTINAPIFNTDTILISHYGNQMNGALTTSASSKIVFDCQSYTGGLTVSRGFTNNGKIYFQSTTGYGASLGLDSNLIINAAGGEIIVDNTIALGYQIYAAVNNIGNINIKSGSSLTIQRTDTSSNTGTVSIAANSSLTYSTGGLKMNGGSITGAGKLIFTSSEYKENLSTIPAINTEFNSAFLSTNQPFINNTAALFINYGNIISANIRNKSTGVVYIQHYGNTDNGTFLNEAGSQLIFNCAQYTADINFAQGVTNSGTIELGSITGYNSSITCNGGELLNNNAGIINCNAGVGGLRYLYAQINNKGTLNINAETTILKTGALSQNTGGAVTINGTYTLTVSDMRFDFNSGTLTGSGFIYFNYATYYLAVTNVPNVYHKFNYSKFEAAATVNNSTTLQFYYNDSCKASVNNKASGIVKVSHYPNYFTGTFTTTAGSQLLIDAQSYTAQAFFTNGFVNKGTIDMSSVTGYDTYLTIDNGTLENDTNATLNMGVGVGGQRWLDADFKNWGNWYINATSYINAFVLNNETTGVLRGNATVSLQNSTRLVNKGNMYPGSSTGVSLGQLYFIGHVTKMSGSNLNLQIGGTNPVTHFDQTTTTGTDSLNGALNISLVNSYVPTLGDSFIVNNYGTRIGQFSSVNGTIPGGLAWNIFYRPTYAVIRAGNPSNLTISATAGANGSISPAGNVSVVYNANQTFTFTPANNYVIDSVIVDGSYVGNNSSYTFNNVTINHTIHVTFRIPGYTINASKSGPGTISPSGAVAVNNGGSQTFTITPNNTCSKIDSVIVNGTYIGTPASYTFNNVTSNQTIRAVFGNNNAITSNSGVFSFCAGSSLTLSASSGFNAYSWSNGATSQSISVSSAGTYTVTVTGSGGCQVSNSKNVTQNSLPTVTFPSFYANNKVCFTDGAAYLNGIGTPVGGSYSGIGVSNSFGNFYFNPSTAYGTRILTYTYTNANGCTNTATRVVTVDSNATVNAGADIVKCGNLVIPISATKGGIATTTTWTSSGTGTFANASALNTTYTLSSADVQAGTVLLTITTSNPAGTCGPVSDQVVITYYANAVPVIGGGQSSTCAPASTFQLSGNISGYPSATPLWSTNGTGTFSSATIYSPFYTPSQADINAGVISVYFTAIDPNGNCTFGSDTLVVYFDSYSVDAGNNAVACNANTVSISGTKSNTVTSVTWSSNGSGTFANANALNTTYTFSAADKATGGATLIITTNDPSGPCGPKSDYMYAQYKTAIADAGPASVCGDTIWQLAGTYTGAPGTLCNALWSSLGTGSFNNATAFNATYTASAADKTAGKVTLVLSLTDQAGQCNNFKSDTIVVWFNPHYLINAGSDSVEICGDKILNLSGTRQNTNTSAWTSSGTGTFANANALNTTYNFSSADTAAGFVIITLSSNDPTGPCGVVSDSRYVTIKDIPKATAGTNSPVCVGTNLNLTASGGNGYAWSGPNSYSSSIQNIVISNAQVNMSGVYTVTVSNLIGCSATASTTATVTNCNCVPPVVQLGKTNVSCNGGSDGTITTTINNVAGPYSYLWSNGMTVQNPTGLPAGTYTVTVTTTPNCTGTASVNITQPAVLNASSTVTNTTCGASNGSVVMNVTGGTAPYQYLWNTNPPQNTSVISSLVAGSYLCTVTDAKGCTKTLVSIVQTTGGSISNVTVTTKKPCFQDNNGKLTIKNIVGGTAPYTYLWNTGAVTSSISSLSQGTYTLTVTDAGNCSFVKVINVVQWSQIKENLTVIDAGCNQCNGIAYVAPTGGKKPYRYSWNTVPQDLDSLTSGLCAGNYTLTIRDTANCVKIVPVAVSDGKPQVTAAITNVTCNGGNSGAVNITVTSGVSPYSYLWSNGKTSKNNLNAMAGTYTVTVTSTGGCSNTKSSVVAEPMAIAISFDTTATTAKALPNGGTSPYAYMWSNGKTNAKIVNLNAGTYTVTVTDANGCTQVASVSVNGPRIADMGFATISSMVVYPNPANTFINITFEAFESKEVHVSMYNHFGQLCLSKTFETQTGITQLQMETTQLTSGIYEIRVESAGAMEKQKVVIVQNK